jgi:hypothetical protein
LLIIRVYPSTMARTQEKTMLRRMLIGLCFVLAGSVTASAAPIASTRPVTETTVHLAQSRCANWQRECARLYGWQTNGWQLSMGQPGAVRDCSGGRSHRGGYDDEGDDGDGACRNWRRQCARLYGWRTPTWYSCMGQPGAINACAGGR